MKKGFVILISTVVILIATVVATAHVATPTRTANLPRILYNETFTQETDIYFVYFWRDNCSRCREFEPYLVQAFNDGFPVLIVDMNNHRNHNAWYGQGDYRDAEFANRSADMTGISHYHGIEIEGTPTVIRIEDGVVTHQISGFPNVLALINMYFESSQINVES